MNHRHIIAILRGIKNEEAVGVCTALVEAGITLVEVPLNSPNALESIRLAAEALSDRADIGAGTVLSIEDVGNVKAAGGVFIVSPDTNPEVIKETVAQGMASYPGVFSPTDAFTAIRNGASGLKFFPAEVLGPKGIKAVKAVLPPAVPTYAVGGANPDNFHYIYKPGMSVAEVAERAKLAVASYDKGANA
jgi:2-dehydro-3-deoxyphosphogalactonate aldolase